jgi:hypothetical protein
MVTHKIPAINAGPISRMTMGSSVSAKQMICTVATLTVLAIAVVVLRIFCKTWRDRPIRWDDYTLLAALVCGCPFTDTTGTVEARDTVCIHTNRTA